MAGFPIMGYIASRGIGRAMGRSVGNAVVSVVGDTSQLTTSLKTAEAQTIASAGNISKRGGALLQNFGRAAALVGGLFVTKFAVDAVKAASDFEHSMQKVVALAGQSQKDVARWSEEILELAPKLGRGPQELAEALYFITSSGIKAADAMDVLIQSTKGSVAGLGETKEVADVATSALNAYGKENLTAGDAIGQLVQAVTEGKGEASEFATTIGRVIPVAAEMNVEFHEVAAATAAMTREGFNAFEATTSLRQILISILKPAAQTKDLFAEYGLTVEDLQRTAGEEGLLAVLHKLRDAFGDNKEAMARAFPNVRALTGVLNLVGRNAAEVEIIFATLAESGIANLNRSFKTMRATVEEQMKRAKASIDVFGIRLANVIMPAVTTSIQAFVRIFQDMEPVLKAILFVFGKLVQVLGSLAPLLGPIIAGFMAFKAVGFVVTLFNLMTVSVLRFAKSALQTAALQLMYLIDWFHKLAGVKHLLSLLGQSLNKFLTNPMVALVAIVGAAVLAIQTFQERNEALRTATDRASKALLNEGLTIDHLAAHFQVIADRLNKGNIPGTIGYVDATELLDEAVLKAINSLETKRKALDDLGISLDETQMRQYGFLIGSGQLGKAQEFLSQVVVQHRIEEERLAVALGETADAVADSSGEFRDQTEQNLTVLSDFADAVGTSTSEIIADANKAFAQMPKDQGKAWEEFLLKMELDYKSFVDEMASGFSDFGTIISDAIALATEEERALTAGDILSGLQAHLDVLRQYSDAWGNLGKRLKELGIDRSIHDLMAAMSEMGLEGLPGLLALEGTDDKTLRQIAKTTGQITKTANDLATAITKRLIGTLKQLIVAIKGIPDWSETPLASHDKGIKRTAENYSELVHGYREVERTPDTQAWIHELADTSTKAKSAGDNVKRLGEEIRRVPKDPKIRLDAETNPADAALGAFKSKWEGQQVTIPVKAVAIFDDSSTTTTDKKKKKGKTLHRGGWIGAGEAPGGRSDEVDVRAQRGEFIINKESAKRYRDMLESINASSIRHPLIGSGGLSEYHHGGIIEGGANVMPTLGVDSQQFADAINASGEANMPDFILSNATASGLNSKATFALQAVTGTFPWAGLLSGYRPGSIVNNSGGVPSQHGFGNAIDISTNAYIGGGDTGSLRNLWDIWDWEMQNRQKLAIDYSVLSAAGRSPVQYSGGGLSTPSSTNTADHWNHIHMDFLRKGGMALRKAQRMVGESGREAIIPLDSEQSVDLLTHVMDKVAAKRNDQPPIIQKGGIAVDVTNKFEGPTDDALAQRIMDKIYNAVLSEIPL